MTARILAAATLAAALGAGPALAADPDLRVALQSAMLAHIDEITVDGAYTYLDPKEDVLRTVYPANVHPMVVSVGDTWFVCSEMVDAEGNSVTADFMVRQVGGEWRVTQALFNDRGSLQAAMRAAK